MIKNYQFMILLSKILAFLNTQNMFLTLFRVYYIIEKNNFYLKEQFKREIFLSPILLQKCSLLHEGPCNTLLFSI